MFKTIKENISAEIVEKKSKFIANVFYVETREEVDSIIKEINKKYHDARHNCYAYRVVTDGGIIEKSSDDGEPSGTAGAPMLTILSKNNLANILVVVTRYFGGILLGTGGLVKAYSSACTLAIEKAGLVEKEIADLYKIECVKTHVIKWYKEVKENFIYPLQELIVKPHNLPERKLIPGVKIVYGIFLLIVNIFLIASFFHTYEDQCETKY